jgi:type IV pilus assembly protein PilP
MRAAVAVLIVVLLPTVAFAQAKPAPAKGGQPAAPPPPAPPAAAGSAAVPAGAAPVSPAPAPPAAVAQPPQSAGAAAPQPGAAATAQTAPPPIPAENFKYDPDGRRDPFLSLVDTGTTQNDKNAKKGDGVGAFALSEVSVRGIIQSKGRLLAMAETPDGKTYLIHAGDKLADGVVKSVTSEGLVFIQDINDPLSVQKQREVRKLLRTLEDAKE